MTTFEWLNPIIQVQTIALLDGVAFEGENEKIQFMFDVGASMEKCSWALIINELSFF
jgi:hypothetical protein